MVSGPKFNGTFRWAAGILATACMGLLLLGMTQLTGDVNELESELVVVKEDTSAVKAHYEGIDHRLNRIEAKLDRLVERGN